MIHPPRSLPYRHIFTGLALFVLVAIMPVSASYYQVAPQVSQGATVFIGEQNLNITSALFTAQSKSGLPNTANTIGWWASAAVVSTTPPSKTVDLTYRNLSFSAVPSDFVGYTGTWYMVNNSGFGAAPILTIADPTLDIRIWDFDQAPISQYGGDVTGRSVTQGDLLGFRIDTAMTAVFNGRRSPVNFMNGNTEVTAPAGTVPDLGVPVSDGYINIRVRTDSGNVLTSLYNGSVNAGGVGIPITALNVSVSNWFWGVSPGTTSPSPLVAGPPGLNLPSLGGWATGAVDGTGQRVYPAGTYTVWAESLLNNMKDNYQNGGADYTAKTVSQTYTITVVSDYVRIETNMDSVVRSKPFSVTIYGRPYAAYNLWVKATSAMDGSYNNQPPRISLYQAGTRVGDPLTGNYSFQNGGPVSADVSPYIFPGETFSRFFANVTLNAAGTRTVGLETTNWTKPQLFTIHVEQNFSGNVKSDEVDVRVQRAAVTVIAAAGNKHQLGEVIKLSGTNTGSKTAYLFLTGPNLPARGAQISSMDPRSAPVVDNDASTFGRADVLGDNTWSYRWNTAGVSLVPGTYTVFAVSQPRDNVTAHLSYAEYGTTTLELTAPPTQKPIVVTPDSDTIAPSTNVSVNFNRSFVGFPDTDDLLLITDLDNPVWRYSIIVNGVENVRPPQDGHILDIAGFELSYTPADTVTVQATLEGTYPATAGPVTVARIQQMNSRGNPEHGSILTEIRPRHPGPLDPFPGYSASPLDPNLDGLYEDLNGNGRMDFDDVIVAFVNMEQIGANGSTPYFDFNGNRRMDFDDVIQVFDMF